MTQQQLKECKKDLLATYKDELCQESVQAVKDAKTVEELISVIHKFSAFLHYKCIPDIQWVRRWFNADIDTANRCGVYIDQICTLTNPAPTNLVFMGKCHISLILSKPDIYTLMLQDDSDTSLVTYGAVAVTVREKGTGKATIINKDRLSKIKIHAL